MLSKALLTFCLLHGTVLLNGCSTDASDDSDATETGTLSMPLITSAGVNTYRLQGDMSLYGPIFTYLHLGGDTEAVTETLPTGDYQASLFAWALERELSPGNFVPVSANLVSNSTQVFSIFNQTTTSLSYQFETDGQNVSVGSGQLTVTIDVAEIPPVCSVLGGDCPEETWCAPSELTGATLACIAQGPVPVGEPCESPAACTGNTSCFDFGSGPVCTPLCLPAEFNESCSSGGVCTPQGVEYGVCTPSAEAE
jgi:hypothetical protein